ncbi:hypothetical protein [Gelidibacter japonicus]|uniref:hypothetical protein n=1 Tax=Gelidibacter japonicus TaxID=1962232 RepID=UPI003A8CBB7B
MNHFIVTCHGWSASNWTAHSLNLNANILCTHSARNILADDKELQSNKNLKEYINQLQKGYSQRQGRSLDTIYAEIEALGNAQNYGSVHVLRMRDLPVISEKYGDSARSFKVVNIVRNPVDLVWSGYGQFKDLFRYDINELHWTTGKVIRQALEFVNYIGKKYNIYIGDFENLAFIGACAILESLKLDLMAYPKVDAIKNINFSGTFQMEDITSNKLKYKEFLNSLGLSSSSNEDYLDDVFKTGVVNKHKHDSKRLSAFERFNEFLPWQKEVFLHFFNFHDLKKSYESFGYNFDYLKL